MVFILKRDQVIYQLEAYKSVMAYANLALNVDVTYVGSNVNKIYLCEKKKFAHDKISYHVRNEITYGLIWIMIFG